ncbi:MAG TPA: D-alanyl-D-alanine carboxypeptidase [Ruminococcaceae bacterium]|nr:D-alanyl-D-alanine carboxypeptidase [Oscillospiraceae bacterium]
MYCRYANGFIRIDKYVKKLYNFIDKNNLQADRKLMYILAANISKKISITVFSIILCIAILITGICVSVHLTKKDDTNSESQQTQSQDVAVQEEATEEITSQQPPKEREWNLILVNPQNTIPDGYADSITLTQLQNGQAIDSRCYPDLQEMMDACRADGLSPLIVSSFRSNETQESLYNRKINQFKDMGYNDDDAKIEAGRIVAVPGTSEHQLGLAIDVVDTSYQTLDEQQENTPTQKWLMQNSYKYGWILRYPNSKKDITGIIYEPWHYRYVGKEAAEEIYNSGVCLEEYLQN